MTACPKTIRVDDPAYRRSARGRNCAVHDCYGEGVVLAHIATVSNSGMGMKSSDDESDFLCFEHHREMDQFLGLRAEWIVEKLYLPGRRGAYQRWMVENLKIRMGVGR